MHDAFLSIDQERRGRISREQLVLACERWNIPTSEAERLLAAADLDGDGMLDFDEFAKRLDPYVGFEADAGLSPMATESRTSWAWAAPPLPTSPASSAPTPKRKASPKNELGSFVQMTPQASKDQRREHRPCLRKPDVPQPVLDTWRKVQQAASAKGREHRPCKRQQEAPQRPMSSTTYPTLLGRPAPSSPLARGAAELKGSKGGKLQAVAEVPADGAVCKDAELGKLMKELAQQNQDSACLRQRLSQLEEQCDRHQSEARQMKAKCEAAEQELKTKASRFAEMRKHLVREQAERTRQKVLYEGICQQQSTNAKNLVDYNKQMDEARRKTKMLMRQIAALKQEVSEKDNRLVDSIFENKKLQEKNSRLQLSLERTQQRWHNLLQQYNTLRGRMHQMGDNGVNGMLDEAELIGNGLLSARGVHSNGLDEHTAIAEGQFQ
eukprot:TRINITY_DN38294_c0_g1_i1.p1 TRINITY_DN38294_c0_g1~~TRINITY_DN38294_c0_g1_i1.p1  ORF type:complete len:438 (-),score=112.38 TRINITY_DN38294_c0_g1_i1:401-1714(-)